MGLVLLAGLAFSTGAQAQKHDKRTRYYYYPEANVYYNPGTRQYAYDDNGNWGYRRDLPSNVTVQRRSYVTLYSTDPEIWRQNQTHRDKYKDWDKKHGKKDRDRDRDHD